MSQKGFSILENVIKKGYSKYISCVISSRDKSIVEDYYDEIRSKCMIEGINFYDKSDSYSDEFQYQIAVSWRWLISDDKNLIVLHDSLLPKYRGFAPLVNCLKNGESKIGVTAIFANEGYDTGDIITFSSKEIKYPIKIREAINEITYCYNECIDGIFEKISTNESLKSFKQIDDDATYSLWLDELDYKIDWNKDSYYLKRFVDAVGWPYSGAYTVSGNQKYIIDDVEIMNDVIIENRTPGKVLFFNDNCPVVVCGIGLLKIKIMREFDDKNETSLKKFRTRFES